MTVSKIYGPVVLDIHRLLIVRLVETEVSWNVLIVVVVDDVVLVLADDVHGR